MQLNSRNDAAYWAKVPGLSGWEGKVAHLYVLLFRIKKIRKIFSIFYAVY